MKLYKPKTDEDWHKLRGGVVTASLAACLVGANKYQSMQSSWEHRGEFKGNNYTLVGQLLESVVVDLTNMVLDRNFRLFEQGDGTKSFYVDEEAKLGATPDATDGVSLLECKTTKPFNYIRYGNAPPEQYLIQLMVQLHVTEMHEGYLSIMSTDLSPEGPDEGEWPLAIFRVHRNFRIVHLICQEAKRFFKCQEFNTKFRVDSNVKTEVKLLLQTCYVKVL